VRLALASVHSQVHSAAAGAQCHQPVPHGLPPSACRHAVLWGFRDMGFLSLGTASSPGWAPLGSGFGQATYISVPLSPSSRIWYQPRGVISLAGKVTTGLAESNSSLPPGLLLMSPAG